VEQTGGRIWVGRATDGTTERFIKIKAVEGSNSLVPLAFSPDGRRVVIEVNHEAQIIDLETGELVGQLRDHVGHITAALFTPDGSRLITADSGPPNNTSAGSGSGIWRPAGNCSASPALA
jgi:WD40 repeat protein